jgi:beta-lactamase regulating signal transducer with metallopeptidase domain
MNLIDLTSNLAQSIAWTLINTLWQAPIIYIMMISLNRFLGDQRSTARYGISVAALTIAVLSAGITFIVLLSSGPTPGATLSLKVSASSGLVISQDATAFFIRDVLQWIDLQLVWVLRFWAVGFIFYFFRLIAGLWYVNKLKRDSWSLGEEWNQFVRKLADGLRITRIITIAEAKVSSPMVVGYLKPVILFPVGLIAGLSNSQVETILLHELSHIRRHDYIVNIFQVLTEALFFFNPFVWMISADIRRERENCCDDMVIGKGVDPLSYAKTLADLESRATGQLALGIVGDQNELSNRIKRIMQKSAKNDWGNGRLLPASLVVLGLVLASWLSIENSNHGNMAPDAAVYKTQDTLKPKKKSEKQALKKEEASKGEAEESIENYYSFRHNPDGDWGKFEQEFNEKFKSQFGEFFEKNQEQISKMMDELRRAHEENSPFIAFDPKIMEELQHMQMVMPPVPGFPTPEIPESWEIPGTLPEPEVLFPSLEAFEAMTADAMRQAELAMEFNDEALEAMAPMLAAAAHASEMSGDLWALDRDLKEMDMEMKAYEEELHEMLITDGYLKKDAAWSGMTINISENNFTVNGIEIKKQHIDKYKAAHDKYFPQSKSHWIRKTE